MTRTVWAWLAFVVLVCGVLNAGVDRATERALEHQTSFGAADAIAGARLLYTDSADPRRYFAYGNAVLGRPAAGYYVRSEAAWQAEFTSGTSIDPESVPDVVPAAPLVPYRDFAVEYPPLVFAVVVPVAAVVSDADGFRVAFGVAMALVLAAALGLALRLARQTLPGVAPWRIIAGTAVAAFLLGVVVTHRFDAVVAVLLVGTFVALAEDRPVWTGALLGVAVGVKLVPVVIAPLVALRWISERRWGALGRALAAGTVALAASLGPLLLLDPGGLTAILRYHAGRPLQVESTWAAALRLVAAAGGPELHVVKSYGSINAEGGAAGAALALVVPALLVGLGVVIAATWRRARAAAASERALWLVRGAVAALVVCMALGKVFSPQYLTWLLPVAVPLALHDGRRSLLALAAVLLLSQIIYPIGNPALQAGAPWVSALVLARNVTLLAWALVPLLRRAPAR